jgi:hypothetical protein
VAAVPFRPAAAVVVPFHLAEAAVGHRNQAAEEVGQRTHCTERVRRPCFSVVAKVEAVLPAVFPAVAEPRLQQVRRYREGRTTVYSQRTSGRSTGCFLLPEWTAH